MSDFKTGYTYDDGLSLNIETKISTTDSQSRRAVIKQMQQLNIAARYAAMTCLVNENRAQNKKTIWKQFSATPNHFIVMFAVVDHFLRHGKKGTRFSVQDTALRYGMARSTVDKIMREGIAEGIYTKTYKPTQKMMETYVAAVQKFSGEQEVQQFSMAILSAGLIDMDSFDEASKNRT